MPTPIGIVFIIYVCGFFYTMRTLYNDEPSYFDDLEFVLSIFWPITLFFRYLNKTQKDGEKDTKQDNSNPS